MRIPRQFTEHGHDRCLKDVITCFFPLSLHELSLDATRSADFTQRRKTTEKRVKLHNDSGAAMIFGARGEKLQRPPRTEITIFKKSHY
jgi:hypothetical protein